MGNLTSVITVEKWYTNFGMMLSYFNDIYLIENDSILSEPTTEPTTKNNKPTQITDNQYYFYINSSPSLTAR